MFDTKEYTRNFDHRPYQEAIMNGTYTNKEAAASDYAEFVVEEVIPASVPDFNPTMDEIAELKDELEAQMIAKLS